MEENKLSIQNKFAIGDIKKLIYTIRGKQVMMDSDVANIYHCETKYVNRVVKRNIERFPEEFCFQLNENEFEVLRCQFVTLNENGRGQHRKYLPYVFTEQGIAMLSALLKSDEKIEKVSFNLSEISPKEIEKHRKGGKPTFFLKMNDKYYFTEIPESLTFENSKLLGVHRCAFAGHECQRLSAAKDEKGGCKKVRDRVKRIERYPWIKVGYETFNTKYDCFIVIECSHYEHR